MQPLTRFFQFLSKTDRRVIEKCTDIAVKTQVTAGIFVLLTGSFAFLSCFYAVYSTFGALKAAIPVALLYSACIVFVDREIVSATSKLATLPRIGLAIIVGMVISVPLELLLFQNRIDQELVRNNRTENQAALDQMREDQQNFQRRITALETEMAGYRQNINEAGLAMQDETTGAVRDNRIRTGIAGEGAAYRAAKDQLERNQALLAASQTELQRLQGSEREVLERINRAYEQRAVPPVKDLLSRYEALEKVKVASPSTWTMAWGVRLLIIMIEVIPALMKLLQQTNEYNVILEATRRINITRVYAIANDSIDQIIASPNVLPTPTLLQQLETNPLTK